VAATQAEFETEQQARRQAEERAGQAERAVKLADAISAKGYVGERAALLRRLVDPAADDLPAAISGAVAAHRSMFVDPEPAPPTRAPRRGGPTTPPAETSLARRLPGGYVSPEEYVRTPMATRYSPEFQRRVAASRPHWPKHIDPRQLPTGNS
jgi:hypothetical protein